MRRVHCAVRTAGSLCLALGIALSSSAILAADKVEVEITKDVPYGNGGGEELQLDIGVPKGLDRAVPAIVVIHGGGWMQGNRSDMTKVMERLAEQGYVAATISYRFAPKHRFPAQIEDVKCAVRYLRAHADKWHIDEARIGAIGISAGAHLSLMLGTLDSADGMEGEGGHAEESSKVQAVVSFVGPVNLSRPSYTETQEQILEAFFGGKPLEKQADCRRASPLTYVSKGDAPMLLFFGTKDPLIDADQAYQISEAMTEAGVPGRVEMLVGAQHGWQGAEMERTLDASVDFFDEQLKKKP